jgi:hypothetical protein
LLNRRDFLHTISGTEAPSGWSICSIPIGPHSELLARDTAAESQQKG